MNNKQRTQRLTIIGILTAIIILQTFVPALGYIPIPPVNPTILHLTVTLAAITLGPRDGAIIGGVWGTLGMIRAYVAPASPISLYIFTNPFVSILPRILVGLVAGLVYRALRNRMKRPFALAVTGFVGAITNTVLVMGIIYFFFGQQYAELSGVDYSLLRTLILTIIGTNGVPEAIAGAVLLPILARPLSRFEKELNP